jgi:protein N-terminal methyltransferase
LKGKQGIGEIFNVGLEEWSPDWNENLRYDLIWNQWCLGHLTDAQLVAYLKKCANVVREEGWIIVKENLSTSGQDDFDEIDSSVTRYITPLLLLTGEWRRWLKHSQNGREITTYL